MPLIITEGDITRMTTEAIVNSANTRLLAGGGVCGAIFRAAGLTELQAECQSIGFCETGQAVITSGYKLPAKFIIHTVGPVWQGGNQGEAALLAQSYASSLELARSRGILSIAFPLISSGIFGYPAQDALAIAKEAITAFLREHEMEVFLVLFDHKTLGRKPPASKLSGG